MENSDVELTANERKVLRAICDGAGGKAGNSGLDDDDLCRATGLTAEEVQHATFRLVEVGFIEPPRHS